MSRDIQKITNKKNSINTRIGKQIVEKSRLRKMNESSDDDEDEDDNNDESSEEEYTSDDDESATIVENKMNTHEYRKFLAKIFPSNHISNKIKAGNRLNRALLEEEEEEEEERTKSKSTKKEKKQEKDKKKKKKVVEEEEEEEDEEEEEEEEEEEDEKDVVNTSSKKTNKTTANNYNIIFTIGKNGALEDDEDYDEDEEDEWTDDDDNETEDEDESVDTDSSNEEEGEDEDGDGDNDDEEGDVVGKEEDDEEVLNQLKESLKKDPKNKMILACIKTCEQSIKDRRARIEKKTKRQKEKNSRIFKRIIRDRNTMNDFTFFSKMESSNQIKIIKELREINKIMRIEKPYRLTLLESNIPPIFKAAAMKKISSLRHMEPGSGEYYKIKNWVDTFMRIPFGQFETLPVNIADGVDKCHDFMANAQSILDSAVYGLNDAKMQIMQMLGQLVTNPLAIGAAIAINGPPGTGKTSLVKEGISKILNRPFAFIALGGATDSSFLEGHSYTYEGSTWGKIVQILIDSKCMNPVIYFDELDKISDTPKGEEIAGILTHLTDTSQNSQFHDKYFAEIDFDLSKCLFIFSYNDESKINPILKDRMYRILTKGYEKKQKTVISNQYLLPKIRDQVKFQVDDIIIPDDALHHIIENHCASEDGVRNLKRCLEIIYTKLNLYRLMRPGSNLFQEDMSLSVEFPFTVTKDIVDKLIKTVKPSMGLAGLYI